MKFELKNFSHYPRMSEETNAFNGTLYIDGVKTADCRNEGHGGCTFIHALTKEARTVIEKAEAYAKSLPEITYDFGDGAKGSYPQTLETIVDDLVAKKIEENWLNKSQKSHFVLEKEGDRYTEKIPNKLTMEKLIAHKDGPVFIEKRLAQFKKEGFTVLNTNLPILSKV